MKITSHSKAETILEMSVNSQLLQKIFHKYLYLLNDEVRAGCPKLGNTTLALIQKIMIIVIEGQLTPYYKDHRYKIIEKHTLRQMSDYYVA